MSESKSLAEAFVAAWGRMKNPEMDSENQGFKRNGKPSKYASLLSCMKVVREACREEGIAYTQLLNPGETGFEITSRVAGHGEVLELSTFPVTIPPNPQEFGKFLTYTKRQQVQADWGIVGEEDDDGNAAAEIAARQQPAAPQRRPVDKRKKMLARCAQLSAKCIENGMNAEATDTYMVAHFDVKSMDELNDEQLIEFGTYLKQMEEQSRAMKERKNDVD